jgi:hypothetical protein
VGVEDLERVLVNDEQVEHLDLLDRVRHLDHVPARAGGSVRFKGRGSGQCTGMSIIQVITCKLGTDARPRQP